MIDPERSSRCRQFRVSQVLILNILCCAIGVVGAWDAWWIIRYQGAIQSLFSEAIGWLRML